MDAFGEEYHSWMFAESVHQCSIKFEMQSVIGKTGDWINCVTTSERFDTNYCQVRTENNLCMFLSSTKNIFLCAQNVVQQCPKKERIWKFLFPWRKVNWHVLQTAKAHFKHSLVHMVSEKVYVVHITFLDCVGAHMYQKSQQTRYAKEIVFQNFQFFQLFNVIFMCICCFYRYKLLYTYRRKEFQNILERKLWNCFKQLLLIYYKNAELGIKHVIDSAHRVCIH